MNNDVKMSLVYLTSLPSRPSEDPHRVQAKVSSRLRYHIRPQCAAGSDHPSWLNWCLRLISKAFSCTFHRELPRCGPQYEVQFRQCHHLMRCQKSIKKLKVAKVKTLLIKDPFVGMGGIKTRYAPLMWTVAPWPKSVSTTAGLPASTAKCSAV